MTINKSLVKKRFDLHAHEYDQFAGLQREMAQYITRIFSAVADPQAPASILEIGCGTGELSAQLVQRFPEAELTLLDISEKMLGRARQRIAGVKGNLKHCAFIEADAEHYAYQLQASFSRYDWIVSNACFQWFEQPLEVLQEYAKLLGKGGRLVMTTFGPQTFRELHQAFYEAEEALHLPHVPRGQSYPSVKAWREVMLPASMQVHVKEEIHIARYADVRAFLHAIRRLGAGNATTSKTVSHAGGRKLFKRMMEQYTDNYALDGGIQVTYHLIYIQVT